MRAVLNLSGTGERVCSCGSWLRHWENFSGFSTKFCQVDKCLSTDIVGAHIKIAGGDDTTFILPLCREHNQFSGILVVAETFPLVLANKSLTCERPRW